MTAIDLFPRDTTACPVAERRPCIAFATATDSRWRSLPSSNASADRPSG